MRAGSLFIAALLGLAIGAAATGLRVERARHPAPVPRQSDELEQLRRERSDLERYLPMRLNGRIIATNGYDAGTARE